MKIIIIGAGLGGLSAAVCFSRHRQRDESAGQAGAGRAQSQAAPLHSITVLEHRAGLSPQGNAINIRPGASRLLHSWSPSLRAELEGTSDATQSFVLRSVATGDVTMRRILTDVSDEVDWGTTRMSLMRLLYEQARAADGVQVRFGARAVDVGELGPRCWVELADGSRLEADVVLVADGIRSKLRTKVLALASHEPSVPSAFDPVISDVTLYGLRIDGSRLKARADTKRLLNPEFVDMWQGDGRLAVSRYSQRQDALSVLYGVRSANDMKGLWDENGDLAFVRQAFEGCCEDLAAALDEAPSCDRWKMAELPNLPQWYSKNGSILLLGDAAHAMHPSAAQGYSMTVEDVGALDFLLHRHRSEVARGDMVSVSRTWQGLRKPRVERIKAYARDNTELFLREPVQMGEGGQPTTSVQSLRDVRPRMNASTASLAFLKWCLDYDVVAEAQEFVEAVGRPRL